MPGYGESGQVRVLRGCPVGGGGVIGLLLATLRPVSLPGAVGEVRGVAAGVLWGVGINISSEQDEIWRPCKVETILPFCPRTVRYLLDRAWKEISNSMSVLDEL